MKRIVWWGMSTVTAVVLLFGYRTSTEGAATTAAAPITATTGSDSGDGNDSADGNGSDSGASTVTGDSVSTRWGDIQVAITVADGAITDVSVPVYPNGNGRDAEINASALPTLISETISAQSAAIDMVSGATVTSIGYQQSLQSAIDQAGL